MMTERTYSTLNTKFTASPRPCPCCGEMALETAQQPMLVPRNGQTEYTLIHCKNPDCDGYALTLKAEVFFEQFGA